MLDLLGATAPLGALALVGLFRLLAMAVLALAELVDVRVAVARAVQQAQRDVEDQASRDAEDDLDGDDYEHPTCRRLMRDEDGDHLVRGREDDRHERAGSDHAPGVERRRHRREPALGQRAEQAAHHRSGGARTLDGLLHLMAREVLERLHGEVRHKEERHELERVYDGIGENVDEKIQGRLSFLPRARRRREGFGRTATSYQGRSDPSG